VGVPSRVIVLRLNVWLPRQTGCGIPGPDVSGPGMDRVIHVTPALQHTFHFVVEPTGELATGAYPGSDEELAPFEALLARDRQGVEEDVRLQVNVRDKCRECGIGAMKRKSTLRAIEGSWIHVDYRAAEQFQMVFVAADERMDKVEGPARI